MLAPETKKSPVEYVFIDAQQKLQSWVIDERNDDELKNVKKARKKSELQLLNLYKLLSASQTKKSINVMGKNTSNKYKHFGDVLFMALISL
jgi:hypothetical protein